ncbi:hypothetical protein Tco_0536130 [Tanacetum coccineum]
MDLENYKEGQSMQRSPLFEAYGFIYWKNRFEIYVKSKDNDLWHIIVDGDYKPTFRNTSTDRDETLPYERLIIMEYLVNISKRRAFWSLNEDILKINDSDNQYAVSIKEDTTYPCLHSPKTTKETSSIRRIQRRPIRHIQDIVCEYSGRYQTWSLLQETPIRRIQPLGYALNKAYPLPSDTAYPTLCPIHRIHLTDQYIVVHDKEFN